MILRNMEKGREVHVNSQGDVKTISQYYSFVAAGSPTCIWSREKSIFQVQVRREIEL